MGIRYDIMPHPAATTGRRAGGPFWNRDTRAWSMRPDPEHPHELSDLAWDAFLIGQVELCFLVPVNRSERPVVSLLSFFLDSSLLLQSFPIKSILVFLSSLHGKSNDTVPVFLPRAPPEIKVSGSDKFSHASPIRSGASDAH